MHFPDARLQIVHRQTSNFVLFPGACVPSARNTGPQKTGVPVSGHAAVPSVGSRGLYNLFPSAPLGAVGVSGPGGRAGTSAGLQKGRREGLS